ncbi:DUF3313 domain-containing protein [Geminicoccus flavidas]|uniref:DUF3313 domain-containing protein n=1 Tax=Geminicoccus flavidas TaxID=2506407 RepID=UPI0013567EBC|nr:DUF3313 domain-containing protein [Geminicoccus flavidas]
MRIVALAMVGSLTVLTGCGGGDRLAAPVSGVAGSAEMRPTQGVADAWNYTNAEADLTRYRTLLIERAEIYSGPQADFAGLPRAEVEKIAQMLPEEAKKAVGAKYRLVNEPGPDVARLKFTLVRIEETVPYVSTLTRVIPIGAVVNLGQEAAGNGGTLTGSLTVVLEAFDSQTGELLVSAQRRVAPAAFDLKATMGTEETAQAVAEEIGQQLVRRLDEIAAS